MNATELMNSIIDLQEKVKANPIANKEDMRTFYKDLVKLILDNKMIGRIYDYFTPELVWYSDRARLTVGVEQLIEDVGDFTAAFPDVVADMEDTIVCPDGDGYRIAARMRLRGTNTGLSSFGAPTGKGIGEGGMAIHFIYLRKEADGQWRVHKLITCSSAEWLDGVRDINSPMGVTE